MQKGGTNLSKDTPKRGRDLAAQVGPPRMEREIMSVMVDTLSVLYYEKMVGYAPSKAFRIWSLLVKGSMWVRKEANLIILLGRLRKLGQTTTAGNYERSMLGLAI